VKRRRPSPPVVPAPPEREHVYPAWYAHGRWGSASFEFYSLKSTVKRIQEGRYRLPRFQREWVWTDEQVIKLFDSFVQGYHVGNLLLWERYGLSPSTERFGEVSVESDGKHDAFLVVDGQQRLGSLATAALSGRFLLDLQTGALTNEGPGPWRVPPAHFLVSGSAADNLRWPERHAHEHGLDQALVWDAWTAMFDTLGNVQVSAVRLGPEWSLPRVMESFRRLNTEGTPMDAAMLGAALARATEGTS